jgi:hypothetical protein
LNSTRFFAAGLVALPMITGTLEAFDATTFPQVQLGDSERGSNFVGGKQPDGT